MDGEHQFRIADSFTPETLPMERRAEYMIAFARLLGEEDRVRFRALEAGSVKLQAMVDAPARPKVRDRLRGVRDGNGPREARKAYSEGSPSGENDA